MSVCCECVLTMSAGTGVFYLTLQLRRFSGVQRLQSLRQSGIQRAGHVLLSLSVLHLQSVQGHDVFMRFNGTKSGDDDSLNTT